MTKEQMKKLAELELRVGVLADSGKWSVEELEEFEKILAELEVLVR